MLAMGSVGQDMLACAIRVKMKHLERSYSTFCCSISDILSFVTPPPPAFTYICANAFCYASDGFCGLKEACICNNGSNEAFRVKLFNFLLLNFRYLFLCHPTPLCLQEIVALHSIMIAMGSVSQKKLATAIRV